VRSWPPGRARSCGEPVTPRSVCRRPGPPWSASTAGRRRGRGRAVAARPHRQGLGGRGPRLPSHRWLLQRADRGRQPPHQEDQARRARLPQPRQLPAAAAAPLRGGMANFPDRETARPLTTLSGVEPSKVPCSGGVAHATPGRASARAGTRMASRVAFRTISSLVTGCDRRSAVPSAFLTRARRDRRGAAYGYAAALPRSMNKTTRAIRTTCP
jgi:hypothetical protein